MGETKGNCSLAAVADCLILAGVRIIKDKVLVVYLRTKADQLTVEIIIIVQFTVIILDYLGNSRTIMEYCYIFILKSTIKTTANNYQ